MEQVRFDEARFLSRARKKMNRILNLLFGMLAMLASGHVAAQSSPLEKPIHIIVGFPPGSQPDIVARLLGHKLSEALQRSVVVENTTGASGNIAAQRVAKAAPDGSTLGLLSQTQIAINPRLYKVAFDPVRDFAPVSQLTVSPNILVVHNAIPATSVQELVALARAHPGSLTFASSGSGSGTHIAAELFKSTAAISLLHIPYKGVVAAVPDLIGGRVTMMFSPIPVVLPLVREGQLRALAVTSLKRSSAMPELPTVAESGYPGFEATNWYGLFAPAATPVAIVRKLNIETVNALALPDLHGKLADLGMEVIGSSPDEFTSLIKAEILKWARVIKGASIKPD
jgi:tripartite-type tricarboxylate transporter receptor subunit TctC